MSWSINDWDTTEDPKWEVTETDTDDEFDDSALSRLGVDVPECVRETRPAESFRQGVGTDMSRLHELIRGIDNPEIRAAMESIVVDPRGIDPEVAGFDDVNVPEDSSPEDDHSHLWDISGTDIEEGDEQCPYCGNPYEDCSCPVEDYDYGDNSYF